ncbi:group III truncated hemoglobin [Mucilaginibacter aquatilis]|uniref:Globin n=1 Tax=Mucilaginibacter aquatilis TaxID=1517760 RepID=A0A6I4IR65_9SPHI|nr:group III truncated hemoglobin [Mucilaginibacter aquatilis]MVN92943.1 globin [Mucilaginibacter aquatilis]
MGSKREILNLQDIKVLVDGFYNRVRNDELLGPVFNARVENRWPEHLEKMYKFWQTLLLDEHTYNGRPFPPHATLPVEHQHFERWKAIFNATIDEHFTGNKADEAKQRAQNIAKMFEIKVAHFQGNSGAIM